MSLSKIVDLHFRESW